VFVVSLDRYFSIFKVLFFGDKILKIYLSREIGYFIVTPYFREFFKQYHLELGAKVQL